MDVDGLLRRADQWLADADATPHVQPYADPLVRDLAAALDADQRRLEAAKTALDAARALVERVETDERLNHVTLYPFELRDARRALDGLEED